jgi:hypothetical protein
MPSPSDRRIELVEETRSFHVSPATRWRWRDWMLRPSVLTQPRAVRSRAIILA